MKQFDITLGIKHLHTLIICVKSLHSRAFLETLKYFSRKSERRYLHQILLSSSFIVWFQLKELRKRFHPECLSQVSACLSACKWFRLGNKTPGIVNGDSRDAVHHIYVFSTERFSEVVILRFSNVVPHLLDYGILLILLIENQVNDL